MRRLAFLLTGLLVVGAGCYLSAVIGYWLGGPQYQARWIPADAAYTVVTLRALRKGDVDSAIHLLETRLDSQIIEHSTFDPRMAFWLEVFFRDRSASNKLMTHVAAYRDDNPSSAPRDLRAAVDAHLAGFKP